MNPFDELEQRVVKNPFAFDEKSPITVAVNTEAARQALMLFKSAFDDISISRTASGLDSAFPFSFTPRAESALVQPTIESPAAIANAVFGDIWDDEPPVKEYTVPTVYVEEDNTSQPARPRTAGASAIVRSATDARLVQMPEQQSRQLYRAASARAVVSRRASSRCVQRAEQNASSRPTSTLLTPSSTSLTPSLALSRPASSRAISSRAGAIAAGDEDTINLVRSRSKQLSIGVPLAPGAAALLSPIGSPRNVDEEQRQCVIIELILQKFRKHIRCEECPKDHFCMCSRDCEETATVFSQRYGRLGNVMRVRPGYYCINHLVEIFIDAYDEEKRMADIEKSSYRRH